MDTGTLQMMYNMGLKNSAAMSLPQQLQNEQALQTQAVRSNTLANDQTQAMNPLDQMFKQGQINQQGANLATTQAQLPGVVGQSQSLASQGAVDQATQGSRIDVKNSDNANQIGVNQVQKMAREGQIASYTGQILKQYPPAIQHEVAKTVLQKFGVEDDSPLYHALDNLPPDKVAEGLSTIGDGMVQHTGDYIKSMALQASKNANDVQTTGMNNTTSITVANINAQAKVQAAQLRAQQMVSTMGIDKTIAMYERQKAAGSLSPEEDQALQNLKYQQLIAKAVPANGVAPEVMGSDTPVQIAAKASQGPGGVATPAQPAAPQAPQPQAASTPNSDHILLLKQHPELAEQFDAKFGKGAAKHYLGN